MTGIIRTSAIIAAGLLLLAGVSFAGPHGARGKAGKVHASRKGKRSEARERRNEAKEKRAEKREELKEKRAEKRTERKEKLEEAAAKRGARRKENQKNRIEHGIKKGYLTEEETEKIVSQQKEIGEMAATFKGDGEVTKEEAKTLRSALSEASRCIFAEKHDTDGEQMSVYRMGENVKLNDDVAEALADEDLSKEEARTYAKDFQAMMHLKKTLSNAEISDSQREKMQSRYDELLNTYFSIEE